MKPVHQKNASSPALRLILLGAVFCATLVIFVGRLVSLQIARHDFYAAAAQPKIVAKQVIETTRGEIYDRNGVMLVSNQMTQNLRINRATLPSGRENEIIAKLIPLLKQDNIVYEDHLPIPLTAPYELNPDYLWDDEKYRLLQRFLKRNDMTKKDLESGTFYEDLKKRYQIGKLEDSLDQDTVRRLVGIRYDMEVSDFSSASPFVILQDADMSQMTTLLEYLHELPGIEIGTSMTRYFNEGALASHVLGQTGPIHAEQVDAYLEKGYALDATVGIDGVERAFEQDLRGIDGTKTITMDSDGDVLAVETDVPPKVGNSVRLTIDAGLQRVAEQTLDEIIHKVQAAGKANGIEKTGEDCQSGCIVVMDPNNGEVLALANYPSYDANTYLANYTALYDDETRPLLNRAANGIYPPGSTFKVATSAAALTYGVITPETTIYDKGIYTKYETYQPHCWVYDRYGYTHGYVNVIDALQESCNYFFFEIADEMGIDQLNEYAKKLGLGEKTGIEIGESDGILAGPDFRSGIGETWNPGDTIQAAIGQSDNAFTPLQLATFMSTVVNGGTRYRAHLLKSVDAFYTKQPIRTVQSEIIDQAELSPEHLSVLKQAMKQVVEVGTAASVFQNYPYHIGGKTGTAEHVGGSDTSVFTGFAPFDAPEIVVVVVLDNGYQGYNAVLASKNIFDYYFENLYQDGKDIE